MPDSLPLEVDGMKDHQKAEDTAAVRVQWVAPLLAPRLDAARKRVLMAEVCAQTGLSERTVRRYLARYQESGFSGLKPRRVVKKSDL